MTRPSKAAIACATVAALIGYRAVKHRRELAAFVEVWRLPTEPSPVPASSITSEEDLMALTITEAHAVNQLLDYLLRQRGPGGNFITRHDAQKAAELLAGHAHKTLMTGLRPADVAAAWSRIPPRSGEPR